MTARATWDPAQYDRFASWRGRPFFDLVAQVPTSPATVADLGCGPGNLTATLCDRWPHARVVGVDSSPEMLAAARSLELEGRLRFVLADLATWRPEEPVDLVVSNAALQWVPGHLGLLARLVGDLAPGGVLAFQVPGNFAAPSHVLLEELRRRPPWRDRLDEAAERLPAVEEPGAYLEALLDAGLVAQVWETTYLQMLSGPDPVLEWLKGTTLRPILTGLGEEEGDRFCAELAPLLEAAYPPGPSGTVLPFRRIFAVGRRPPAPNGRAGPDATPKAS